LLVVNGISARSGPAVILATGVDETWLCQACERAANLEAGHAPGPPCRIAHNSVSEALGVTEDKGPQPCGGHQGHRGSCRRCETSSDIMDAPGNCAPTRRLGRTCGPSWRRPRSPRRLNFMSNGVCGCRPADPATAREESIWLPYRGPPSRRGPGRRPGLRANLRRSTRCPRGQGRYACPPRASGW
jgi:hypothetical protein